MVLQQGEQAVDHVVLQASIDPWLSLKAASGCTSMCVRVLRGYLHDPDNPLPHFRLGEPGRRRGKGGRIVRGARILIRASDLARWMERWRVRQAAPPRDVGGALEQAVREVVGPRRRTGTPGSRASRGKPSATTRKPRRGQAESCAQVAAGDGEGGGKG